MVDFLSDIAGTLGADPSQITSTYRTQAQQDALRAKGATQTQHSTHTDGNAFDYVPSKGQGPSDIDAALTAYGYPGSHILDETKPGMGTGPHYHVSNPNFNGAFIPGATPASPQTATPNQVAASPTTQHDPLDVFGNAPEIQQKTQANIDAIAQAGAAIQTADSGLKENTTAHAAAMQESVDKRNAITTDQDAANTEIQNRATPIFAARAALAQRRVELEKMSPFKRAISGIFNRNYDPEHINALDNDYAQQLGEMGDEYNFTTRNRDAMMKDIEVRQAGNDSMASIMEGSLMLDKTTANDTANVAAQSLSSSLMGLQVSNSLIQAQNAKKADTLGSMTSSDINTATAQAKQGGGTAMVSGVPLSLAELQQRSTQLQEQSIGLDTAKLGLQSQKMSVQQMGEAHAIAHMSDADVAAAQANGGVFQGHRLDMNLLAQRVATGQSRLDNMVQGAVTNTDHATYTAGIDRLNQQTQELTRRISGVTGVSMPEPYKQFTNGLVAASQSWQQKIEAAPEAARPQLRAMALQDISKRYSQASDVVDSIAQGMTKNKDSQVLIGGWMKGIPVTGEAATKGLIGMFAGGNGVPKGISMSGPQGKMFAAGQAAYNGYIQSQGGTQSIQQIMAGSGKVSKEEFQRGLMDAVTKATGGAWNNALFAGLAPQIPKFAQMSGHPAGQIRMADLAGATNAGDETAKQALATRLGWTSDQVNSVFGPNGSKEAGYNAIYASKKTQPPTPYGQVSNQFQSDSNTAMLRALDASPSARPGFIPSHAYVEYMNSPDFANRMGQYGSMLPHQSFGSFIGDAVSSGTLPGLMGAHANALYQATGAIASSDQKAYRDQMANYGNDPFHRMGVIASGVPGLNAADVHALVTGVRSQLNQSTTAGSIDLSSPDAGTGARIDSIINHGKFQDPHLEKIRKTAASHWTPMSQTADSIIGRLLKGASDVLMPSN